MNFYEKNRTIFWLLIVVIALVCGYLGGWFYLTAISNVNSNDLINYNPNSSVIIRNPRNIIIEQDRKVNETINTVQKSLVGIFKKDNTGIYNLTKNKAQAMIVTSDGWLITNFSIAINKYKNYVAITSNRKIYEIDKIVKSDIAGFYFLHLKNAKSLPVLSFVDTKNLRSGQIILGVNWLNNVWLSLIVKVDKNIASLKSSDTSNQEIVLQSNYGQNNFVLTNLSSHVVGLIDGKGRFKPIKLFSPVIENLFLRTKINRPKLGINYINSAVLVAPELQNGALVKSVNKNSPADLAGILPNDIILSINGEEINIKTTLFDLISEYKSGEKITIHYSHNGKEKNIEVALD